MSDADKSHDASKKSVKTANKEQAFTDLMEACEMKIDISELLTLVELLDRDELGVRIFQIALDICMNVVNERSKDVRLSFNRLNHSGAQALHSNPYVKDNSRFNKIWYNNSEGWGKLRQDPDGLYDLTVHSDKLHGSVHVIIQYESDGYEKTTTQFLQILRKIYQSVDLQLWWNDACTETYFSNNSTFCIRSNIYKILLDDSLDAYAMVSWLYNFTRSHIYTVLLILTDMLSPTKSLLKREKDFVYDHCFYIGAFKLDFASKIKGLPWPRNFFKDYTTTKNYLNSNKDQKSNDPINQDAQGFMYGFNLPYPLCTTSINTQPRPRTYVANEYELQSSHNIWFLNDLEIQSVGIQRAHTRRQKDDSLIVQGLITPGFLRKHEREAFWAPDTATIFEDKNLTMLNLMACSEMALLQLARATFQETGANQGILQQDGIKWTMSNNLSKHKTIKEITDKKLGLNKLKMDLRNEPHKYRHRNVFKIQDLFEKSQSLQGCAIRSLSDTLPPLHESILHYLENFNIPNATLFCRMLRIPNILALREMARQTKDHEIADQYQKLLKTMPLGTQTELQYLFGKLRAELDVVLDQRFYKNTSQKSTASSRHVYSFLEELSATLKLGLSEGDLLEVAKACVQGKTDPDLLSLNRDEKKLAQTLQQHLAIL